MHPSMYVLWHSCGLIPDRGHMRWSDGDLACLCRLVHRHRGRHLFSLSFDRAIFSFSDRLCTSQSRAQVIQVYPQRTRTCPCHLSSGITTGTIFSLLLQTAWKAEWNNYWILGISSRTLGALLFCCCIQMLNLAHVAHWIQKLSAIGWT